MKEIEIAPSLLKRIHVNQHLIKANRKDGGKRPVLTIKTSKHNYKGMSARICGESVVKYTPKCPLSCGATVYIETRATVYVR